ncbi:hypothetical protein Tco_0873954 [Tanacetum coccineum]|uniref:Reverse transcriptase Ty1/copia-type domain-containing protein n=1 Tax=Tanacetum coccineum TaxID=301880 RepID=A0ABQ5BL14_9ASTR
MLVQTRQQLAIDPEMCMFALTDELYQFDRLKVWELVDKPFGKMIIKLKWLWKNKKDEDQTQAPRAWYDELSTFLMSKGFTKGLQTLKYFKRFEKLMHSRFEMSLMVGDEILLGLQDPQSPNTPTQKAPQELKNLKCLKGTINMGLWYPKDFGFNLTAFSDADHAGCIDTCKSTSGGIQFLGDKLIS